MLMYIKRETLAENALPRALGAQFADAAGLQRIFAVQTLASGRVVWANPPESSRPPG